MKSKVIPSLYDAPCPAEVWGSGSIAARIPNLSAIWRYAVTFTPYPLYSREKPSGINLIGWAGLRTGMNSVETRRFCSCRESNPDSPGIQSVA
jgi:hypothetical protein